MLPLDFPPTWRLLSARQGGETCVSQYAERRLLLQAAQEGPDTRRRPTGRVSPTPGRRQGVPDRDNTVDGPF